MASKEFQAHTDTSSTVYCIIERDTDAYLLNDADGSFASGPADPYVSMTEHTTIKGRYDLSESRITWNDGKYLITVYKQAGASPAPTSDTIVAEGELWISGDAEVVTGDYLSRTLGLALENHVEDDITRDSNGNKTASTLYVYNSATNASTHDKLTGLIASYAVTATYNSSGQMILLKIIKS